MHGLKMGTAALILSLGAPLVLAGGDHEHQHHDDQSQAAKDQGHGDHEHAHSGWTAPAEMPARHNPIAATEASVERGRLLFEASCATCHGPLGRGDGPVAATLDPKPADLVFMAPQHTHGDFAWRVATGRGAMPTWQDVLSENQIWDVVNYLKALPGLATASSRSETAAGHGAGAGDGHSEHVHSDHAHKHE
jgi:mono/diheme cytochrome c family protein